MAVSPHTPHLCPWGGAHAFNHPKILLQMLLSSSLKAAAPVKYKLVLRLH